MTFSRTELSVAATPRLDPTRAAQLSLGIPAAMVATGVMLPWIGVGRMDTTLLLAAAAAPLGAGMGHFYAEAPGRGTLFSLGGVILAPVATLGLLIATEPLVHVSNHDAQGFVAGLWALTSLGCAAYAAYDAYTTTERRLDVQEQDR